MTNEEWRQEMGGGNRGRYLRIRLCAARFMGIVGLINRCKQVALKDNESNESFSRRHTGENTDIYMQHVWQLGSKFIDGDIRLKEARPRRFSLKFSYPEVGIG